MVSTKRLVKGFVIAYFFIFGITFSVYAQARIAIVGGLDESTVIQTSKQSDFSNYKKGYSPRIGFHIGLMGDFRLAPKSKFYFQPGIEFFNKGRKFKQITKNGVGDTSVYLTNSIQFLNYIDIPFNFVYKFELSKKVALIVGAGPYISFFYGGKENSTTVGPDNYYSTTGNISNLPVGNGPGQYRTLDYGINALAGIYLGSSFITANFSRGLQNAYQDSTYSGTFKNQVFSITLGVYLGERKKKANKKEDSTDQDGDGIIDKVDFCPTIPGLKKYNGCPVPDSDGDSINDEEDKCPTVVGLRRYNGCPIPDTDGDSVNDEIDKCPTIKGLAKYDGCPIPIDDSLAADSSSKDTMIYYVYYDPNKIKTNAKGGGTLEKIRDLLKANKTLAIKISGYSDKSSSAKIALKQSASRAIIVRNYMKNNNIANSRMKIYYLGSRKALASSKDKPDQWEDRRVEIAVYQKTKKSILDDGDTTNNDQIKNKPQNRKNSVRIAADKKEHAKKGKRSVVNDSLTDTGVDNSIVPFANMSIKKKHSSKKVNATNDQKISGNNETIITEKNIQTTNNNTQHPTDQLIINNNTTPDNIDSNKNVDAVNNGDQQLLTDTVNSDVTDRTIKKRPSSQIDDTDKVIDCYTIYFDPNQSTLNSASYDILDYIRGLLKNDSTLYVGISGYCERVGSEVSAQKLSQDRAYIARDYMNSYGVSLNRIRVSYWGSKIPVADDNDPYQQWENRRVEICIYVYPK